MTFDPPHTSRSDSTRVHPGNVDQLPSSSRATCSPVDRASKTSGALSKGSSMIAGQLRQAGHPDVDLAAVDQRRRRVRAGVALVGLTRHVAERHCSSRSTSTVGSWSEICTTPEVAPTRPSEVLVASPATRRRSPTPRLCDMIDHRWQVLPCRSGGTSARGERLCEAIGVVGEGRAQQIAPG